MLGACQPLDQYQIGRYSHRHVKFACGLEAAVSRMKGSTQGVMTDVHYMHQLYSICCSLECSPLMPLWSCFIRGTDDCTPREY